MQSILFTDCGMSQDEITKKNEIYNYSNYGVRMRHIPENGLRLFIISFVSQF